MSTKHASINARFEHFPTLDGLRAVSITLVMLSHFVNPRLFPGGFGVIVFFVISGFLITRLLLAEHKTTKNINLKNFYLRRVIRLYPLIVVYTVVTIVLFAITGRSAEIEIIPIFSAIFYFANYFYSELHVSGGSTSMPFAIFWSLSVEEHFYIFFPLLFSTLILRASVLRLSVVALCLLPLAGRIAFAALRPLAAEPQWHWITYFQTQYRIDSIAFGVLLALLLEEPLWQGLLCRLEHPLALGLGVAAILASLLWRDPVFRETWRYTIQAAASAVILINLLYSDSAPSRLVARGLNAAAMVLIGKLSYSLYIWHLFVPLLASTLLPPDLPLAVVAPLYFAASFAVAAASYHLLEIPFLALRRRFRTPTRTAADANLLDTATLEAGAKPAGGLRA